MTTLTLIRGLPGSGKTCLSSMIADIQNCLVYEADDYFYDDYGNYVFDETKLRAAHEWCQHQTREMLKYGYNVLVSNTFTTLREMKEYYLMAKELSVTLNVITCQGQFGNLHNVPQETLDKMEKRFFHGDVIKELGKLYDL